MATVANWGFSRFSSRGGGERKRSSGSVCCGGLSILPSSSLSLVLSWHDATLIPSQGPGKQQVNTPAADYLKTVKTIRIHHMADHGLLYGQNRHLILNLGIEG